LLALDELLDELDELEVLLGEVVEVNLEEVDEEVGVFVEELDEMEELGNIAELDELERLDELGELDEVSELEVL